MQTSHTHTHRQTDRADGCPTTVGQFQTWLQQTPQHCNNFGMCETFPCISLHNFTTL